MRYSKSPQKTENSAKGGIKTANLYLVN